MFLNGPNSFHVTKKIFSVSAITEPGRTLERKVKGNVTAEWYIAQANQHSGNL